MDISCILLYIRAPVCAWLYGNDGDIKLQRNRKNVRFYSAQVVINAFHDWRLRSSCCDGMWNFQRQTHCIIYATWIHHEASHKTNKLPERHWVRVPNSRHSSSAIPRIQFTSIPSFDSSTRTILLLLPKNCILIRNVRCRKEKTKILISFKQIIILQSTLKFFSMPWYLIKKILLSKCVGIAYIILDFFCKFIEKSEYS